MCVGITGSNGFFGQVLSSILEREAIEFQPITIKHSPGGLEPAYLEEAVSKGNFTTIVNLAAVRNPRNSYEAAVNTSLPLKLFQALKKVRPDSRFIHMSSINTVLNSRKDSYSVSKRMAETSLRNYPVTIIRPSIIWSWDPMAGGDAKRLREYLLRPLPFHPFPFPGQIYRPVLAEPLAARIVGLLSEPDKPSVINVFGDRKVCLWTMADSLSEIIGNKLLPIHTAFIEKCFPQAMLDLIPVALRSIDATAPDSRMAQPADATWEIPFPDPSNYMK